MYHARAVSSDHYGRLAKTDRAGEKRVLSSEAGDGCPGDNLPNANACIFGPRNRPSPALRGCDAVDLGRVTAQHVDRFAALQVPNAESMVIGSGKRELAAGCNRNGVQPRRM